MTVMVERGGVGKIDGRHWHVQIELRGSSQRVASLSIPRSMLPAFNEQA